MINAQIAVVSCDTLHTSMRVTLLFVLNLQTWTEVNSYCRFVRIQTCFGFWLSVNQMLEILARGQLGFISSLDLSHKYTVYCSTGLLNIANYRPKINLYCPKYLEDLSFLFFLFVCFVLIFVIATLVVVYGILVLISHTVLLVYTFITCDIPVVF